jgi:hypothetical protein
LAGASAGRISSRCAPEASETAFAQVVAASLGDREREIDVEELLEQGQVLLRELFLEIDRLGGDEHGLVHRLRVVDGRDEIGETLPDARGGLHAQIAAVLERLGDGARHLRLLFAGLVWAAAE